MPTFKTSPHDEAMATPLSSIMSGMAAEIKNFIIRALSVTAKVKKE